eukprot:evm.model.scf_172EXC.4 EVM.evm.TU.scf_172EXC.4   scf_172EXC:92591-95748(+)
MYRNDRDWYDIEDFLGDPALVPGAPPALCEDIDPLPLDADITCGHDGSLGPKPVHELNTARDQTTVQSPAGGLNAACGQSTACEQSTDGGLNAACGRNAACAQSAACGQKVACGPEAPPPSVTEPPPALNSACGKNAAVVQSTGGGLKSARGQNAVCGQSTAGGLKASRGAEASEFTFKDLGAVVEGLEALLQDLGPDLTDPVPDRSGSGAGFGTRSGIASGSGFGAPPDGEPAVAAPVGDRLTRGPEGPQTRSPALYRQRMDPAGAPVPGTGLGQTVGRGGPNPADPLAQRPGPWARECDGGVVGKAYGGTPSGPLRQRIGPFRPYGGPWDRARWAPGARRWGPAAHLEGGVHEASFRMGVAAAAAAAEGRVMEAYEMEVACRRRWAGLKRRWAQERAELRMLSRAKRAAIASMVAGGDVWKEQMLRGVDPGAIMHPRCVPQSRPATSGKMAEMGAPLASLLFQGIAASRLHSETWPGQPDPWAARGRP